MVELHDDLAGRVRCPRIGWWSPSAGASFACLPAEPERLEGLDPTLAILDEIGVISRDVYDVVALAQGKRETSTLLGIGTPGSDPFNNVLADMRAYATENPDSRDCRPSSCCRAHHADRARCRTPGAHRTRR